MDREEREVLLNAFLSVRTWQAISYLWRPNLPDEADNHLVDLAVAGRAEAMVTWNTQDLQRGELRFPGLRIVRPNDFLKADGYNDHSNHAFA